MSGSSALSSSFKVLPFPYEYRGWTPEVFDPDTPRVYDYRGWTPEVFDPDTPRVYDYRGWTPEVLDPATPRGFADNRPPDLDRVQVKGTLVGVINPMGRIAKTEYTISGFTRDAGGNILGGCTVRLISVDGRKAQEMTSDANGAFSFYVRENRTLYFIDAFKAGTPAVMGSTERTRTGEAV